MLGAGYAGRVTSSSCRSTLHRRLHREPRRIGQRGEYTKFLTVPAMVSYLEQFSRDSKTR
jgi:hypothetical protein